jgi:transcriptional regulator with XRE-family HTH domain
MEWFERIKMLRKQKGWSQDTLAQKAGYTDRSMISKIEKGCVDLQRSQLIKFAEVLGTTASELIGESSSGEIEGYYTNDTLEAAQKLFEDRDMRILFDAARDSRPEDLQMAADLLKRLKATNPEG